MDSRGAIQMGGPGVLACTTPPQLLLNHRTRCKHAELPAGPAAIDALLPAGAGPSIDVADHGQD